MVEREREREREREGGWGGGGGGYVYKQICERETEHEVGIKIILESHRFKDNRSKAKKTVRE